MSKAVLISIRPKWCELIASGKKTVEIRKTRPKLETPFKCYIYCTLSGSDELFVGYVLNDDVEEWYRGKWSERKGKVIGEFVCDKIYDVAPLNKAPEDLEDQACMSREEIVRYLSGVGYAWHISNLEVYDTPRELSEFLKPCICPEMPNCPSCPVGYEYISETEAEFYRVDGTCDTEWVCLNHLKRPPQSWCYVEDLDDEIANKERT